MIDWSNKRRAKQLIDFSGLEYGKVHPTDIDGLIELSDKAYIIYEVKYVGKDVPFGQRLCVSRMVDDFAKAGKQAIGLICEHEVTNESEDVCLAGCLVRETYWHGDWYQPSRPMSVKEATDQLIKKWR